MPSWSPPARSSGAIAVVPVPTPSRRWMTVGYSSVRGIITSMPSPPTPARSAGEFHCGGTPDSARRSLPTGPSTCPWAVSGSPAWMPPPAANAGATSRPRGCMNGSPALRGGPAVYFHQRPVFGNPTRRRIRCLDIADGREYWSVSGGGITAPVIAGDRLYAASTADNTFSCYHLAGDAEPRCCWRLSMGDRGLRIGPGHPPRPGPTYFVRMAISTPSPEPVREHLC